MRTPLLLLSTILLTASFGCDSEEKKPEPKPDPEAEAAKKKAEEEAKKEQERKERVAKAFAELEESNKKADERFTDEVKAAIAKVAKIKIKDTKKDLPAILKSPHRSPENAARDPHRHPVETLVFLGIKPNMTVLEVGPGEGWYTEVLAPLLAQSGKLVITAFDPKGPEDKYETVYARSLESMFNRAPELLGKIEQLLSPSFQEIKFGDDEAYDAVLLIRGMHGWQNSGKLKERLAEVHRVLKPGGVFGVVQHRAKADAKAEESSKNGYLPEAFVIAAVEEAGFTLEEKSEINANPKDTTDHEKGVWTLPPTLALEDKDADKYKEIGESDRMTLRFRKK